MKYIKKYEWFEYKYKIGDYVYVSGYSNFEPYAKILKVNKETSSGWDYRIRAWSIDYKKMVDYFYIDEIDIERKLTPEEIEEFEIQINSNKYNL